MTTNAKASHYGHAAILTVCEPMIGKRVADLPGPLQNEFWRFKLAGWVNDLSGVIQFTS